MALFGRRSPVPPSPQHGTASPAPRPAWDLSTVLLPFTNGADPWTVRDACEGTQIFGATGSGKTTGSGAALARAFLRAGFGGLVLTVKPDERKRWEDYADETSRRHDLEIFEAGGRHRLNFLQYEMERPGRGAGKTENLVTLLSTVIDAGADRSASRSDPFWQHAQRQLIRNAVDLVRLAGQPVSLTVIAAVVATGPQTREEVRTDEFDATDCGRALLAAKQRRERGELSAADARDLQTTARYWMDEFAGLAEKTRSVIRTSFTALADCLLRGDAHDLFCTETTAPPELTHEGKIIVLDLPIKDFGDVGRFAQLVYKYLWQRAAEVRDVTKNGRPIFLWADESQYFLTSHDQLFQTTARAARACTVYLTQNVSNYYAAMGGAQAKAAVDSFLGNLQTKIFHANGDPVTNSWAADLIGKTWETKTTTNTGRDASSVSLTPQLTHQLDPIAFTTLAKGGPPTWQVGGVVFQGGRVWRGGLNYLSAPFAQEEATA